MKKSLLVAAALAAFSFSGAASALDTNVVREIRAAGLPLVSALGSVTFTALGTSGPDCMYLAQWESAYNPNEVELCVLREQITDTNPSCIENRTRDFTTHVSAGPGAMNGATQCSGFDQLGVTYEDVTITAGEYAASPILQGVAVFPTALPLVLPIELA